MGLKTAIDKLRYSGRTVSFVDRAFARYAGLKKQATGFISQPEPRTIGSYAKGKQLLAGNLQFGGHLVEAPTVSLWSITPPDAMFEQEINGFQWLDDLASIGDIEARGLAQEWVNEWITLFGAGRGAGWAPDLTGRRIIRWINHAVFLLNGQTSEASKAYFCSLAHQTNFLAKRWDATSRGLPRFEALTGLLYAGLSLEGMEHVLAPARSALAKECREQLDVQGGLPTRNPEELLEVFTLLVWVSAALTDTGHRPDTDLTQAIEKIAPTLRALRHSDGSLARFHGGGKGVEGRLDHALAGSGVKPASVQGLAMGFARMSCGRTSVITDVSRPPVSMVSGNAHASTLAFELTSARRPVIVSCGSGAPFGIEWTRAGRATPSHSTLSIDGVSSAKLMQERGRELLSKGPQNVVIQSGSDADGQSFTAHHDGYAADYGLTHTRSLNVSADGRELRGEDTLAAISEPDRIRFEKHMDRVSLQGVPFSVRFHLHPEIDVEVDLGSTAVSLMLKSKELWVFRTGDGGKLSVEPSVFLEKGRLKPRASKQIVLSGRVMEYASQVSWSLAKAQDTPSYVRDLETDLELALD